MLAPAQGSVGTLLQRTLKQKQSTGYRRRKEPLIKPKGPEKFEDNRVRAYVESASSETASEPQYPHLNDLLHPQTPAQ